MSDPVIIVGGGIGGLTMALMLHQIGVPCTVIESANRLSVQPFYNITKFEHLAVFSLQKASSLISSNFFRAVSRIDVEM